ncbi:MAG: hypothetical protein HQM16_01455 [Deltaproteobacteria bacterium]|nr:hypothetical protein [Deltaproteobacteria bacterium]
MAKNITLRLEESILQAAKKMAFQYDVSLSQWVARLITKTINQKNDFKSARKRALKNLEKGFNLGGAPLTRDQVYER